MYNVASVLKFAISFEVVFVLFLFAGRFKNHPRFEWIPIDLTVAFLAASAGVALWLYIQRRFHLRKRGLVLAALFSAFVGYCVLSYLWTPSNEYATQKLGYLGVLTLWPFLACTFIVGYNGERLRRFLIAVALLSSWILIESLWAIGMAGGGGQLVSALGVSYLTYGRVLGFGALIVIVYGMAITQHLVVRGVCIALSVIYFMVLLTVGGRGPFLAAIIPLVIFVAAGIRLSVRGTLRIKKYIAPATVLVVAGIVSGLILGSLEVLTTLRRIELVFAGSGSQSLNVRLGFYRQALEIWAAHPVLGAGIGAWPVLAGLGDIAMYPHNMILEVLAEFGMVGLILWALPLCYGVYRVSGELYRWEDPWVILIAMLFSSAFLNAMVTADLPGNRVMFAFLGLLLARTPSSVKGSEAGTLGKVSE